MDRLELLKSLVGEWKGTGRGEYPTITPFEYAETLHFAADQKPLLRYEQTTKRHNSETNEEISSHWECGFIQLLDDGSIQVNNAQSGGRVELMNGTFEETQTGFILNVKGTSFLGDPQMQESSRVITLDGDQLHYTMRMRTNTVPEMAIHLEAKLQRSK